MPPGVPPGVTMPVDQRAKVRVEYIDGLPEEYEASGPLTLQGQFLVIPQRGDAWVGINMSLISKWSAVPCRLAVVRGTN
jgi:hypothetical protein